MTLGPVIPAQLSPRFAFSFDLPRYGFSSMARLHRQRGVGGMMSFFDMHIRPATLVTQTMHGHAKVILCGEAGLYKE